MPARLGVGTSQQPSAQRAAALAQREHARPPAAVRRLVRSPDEVPLLGRPGPVLQPVDAVEPGELRTPRAPGRRGRGMDGLRGERVG